MGIPIIKEKPTFAQSLAEALSGGFQSGANQGRQFAQQMELNQAKMKKEQEAQDKGEWENVFGTLRELLPSTGLIPAFPYGEKAKNREKFDVAAFQLERYARAAHTRGALSTKVYQSLLDKLPSSSLTEEKNLGRIEAWEDVLLRNQPHEESEKNEGAKSKRQLWDESNPEHLARRDKVLKKTKGDRKKAQIILEKEFDL